MKNPLDLPIINPHAAGIDVGSEKFFVSVGGKEPRVFLTVTGQIQALCAYLKAEGVRTVAMEATGVYWINLYVALELAGFEAMVVNGAHCRNFPGRKTDMKDCQWLAVLHAHGLLSGGFVPPEQDGLTIFFDPRSAIYLNGIELDYVDDVAVGSGFKFNNPNATGTCGCGESFTV
jgi:hypothetical protein